ncbi:MAG TPA: response regulator [Vicinamibacterales bacterium]|nr:response regulator [Vicinamibacterales bacterium]
MSDLSTASGPEPQKIRILHLEDDPDDAMLVQSRLQREGLAFTITLVDSREQFLQAIAVERFDLVLSDHRLPGFDGLSALRLLREHDALIPFILVSGSLGEEAAIETIRAGVTDYVLKDRLTRLTGCVRRALSEARNRREVQHAEEALRRSEQRFAVALTTMAEGLLVVDRDGTVVMCNPASVRLLGSDSSALTGMAITDALATAKRDTGAPLLPSELPSFLGIGTGRPSNDVSLIIVRPDGSMVSTLVNTRPIAHGGTLDGTVITMHDVTERQRLEAQVMRAQKMDAIGRLSAGIAHDFNNLLIVINNYAEMVVDSSKGDHALFEQGLTIRRAGGRAAQLTQQLLAFSRQQTLMPALLDLRTVVNEMAPMLRRIIGEHIELTVTGDAEVASVNADRGQIDQVIMNLAVNARDAMPDGGRLQIAVTNSSLDASHDNDRVRVKPGPYVELRVTDTGTGMPEATRERVFEPFFTTKEVGKGTGLGLPTVYGIVKQSDGYIWVDSEVGVGSTFRVYMPAVPGAPDPVQQVAAVLPPRGTETIVIVEDDEDVRVLTALMASTAGYQVRTAPNGLAALQMLERSGEHIDLVLTDMVMPGMTGRRFAEQLIAAKPGIKVLYMSGYIDDHRVMGPDEHFIGKPFSKAALLRKVRDVLDG